METGGVHKTSDAQHQVVVEIQDTVRRTSSSSSPQPIIREQSSKPSSLRYRAVSRSAYSKPKSRVLEPQTPLISPALPSSPNPPKISSSVSDPVTPKTPLLTPLRDEDSDQDDDEDVYNAQVIETENNKKPRKKIQVPLIIEWIVFIVLIALLVSSLLVHKLQSFMIWRVSLWKWCVFALVIFCGHLLTEWLINAIVVMIERIFLLKKKVLYFLFALKTSLRVVIWLALILVSWVLLMIRVVERSAQTSRVLYHITRGIVCTLVGAIMWMVKTFLVKLVATNFHVRTYFDRIQESIFHQYILQALSGILTEYESGHLSFMKLAKGRKGEEQVINVDKLYKMRRDKVSAWTMGGLIQVIRNSGMPTVSSMIDDIEDEEKQEGKYAAAPKEITSEVDARTAADRIFNKLAKPGSKYVEEDDLLAYMPKEEVDNAIPLFEGAAETRRIKRSSFRKWVLKAYKERKFLALSLNDAKTAIEELNKIASALVLVVIIIVWVLLMEITTTRVLAFIFSQLLLGAFIFGNMAKTIFEALVFVFVMHPFDVGDRCVIDGVQMIVDEMNIMTTIFLKPDNEKVYYPNSELATKPIGNFNRSPDTMGDSVEFAVDFSTSVATLSALKSKIKQYIESKPKHWTPSHSVQIKEIVNMDKMVLGLYLTHTINFQNSERGSRMSDLILELKRILEELGIKYHLLPQEVHVRHLDAP